MTRVESMALTRQKLLDTALDTFLRVGFGAATIDGISEAAGFSRGAFYANFQSKEEIFLEAISSKADEVTPVLIDRLGTASTPAEAIEIISQWVDERSQSQDLVRLMIEVMQHARRSGPLDKRYAHLFSRNWREVGEALRQFFPDRRLPAPPEEIVAIIVALTYSPVIGSGGRSAGRLVQIVLEGLMKQA